MDFLSYICPPSEYDGNSISFLPVCRSNLETWSYFPWQYISRFFYGSKNKRASEAGGREGGREREGRIAVAASGDDVGGRGVSVPPSSSTSDRSALLIPPSVSQPISASSVCLSVSIGIWFPPPQSRLLYCTLSIDRSLFTVSFLYCGTAVQCAYSICCFVAFSH